MSDLNLLVLQGRIVKDATLRVTKNEKKVADFTIAVNRQRKTSDGNYEDYGNFFRISTFVNSEKFVKYLVKGQPLIIKGFLKQDRWELDDGTKRSQNNIGVSEIKLLFGSDKNDSGNTPTESGESFGDNDGMILDGADEDVYISPDIDDMDAF